MIESPPLILRMLAFCDRCDRLADVPLSEPQGSALCAVCEKAEQVDRQNGKRA